MTRKTTRRTWIFGALFAVTIIQKEVPSITNAEGLCAATFAAAHQEPNQRMTDAQAGELRQKEQHVCWR